MKGIHGLLLAIGLGIAGALFNFAYLAKRSRDVDLVGFVGIKKDKVVGQGEVLTEDKLEKVEIPRRWVGNLIQYAVPWESRSTAIGFRVWRPLEGGSLLLQSDWKSPPQELVFGQDLPEGVEETAIGVPIDSRKFVPSLVQPGDLVSFILTAARSEMPTLADDAPAKSEPSKANPAGKSDAKPLAAREPRPPAPAKAVETVGPFKVLSVGNRLGSTQVMMAAKVPQMSENVLTIAIRLENGQPEPKAARLLYVLDQTNSKPLAYMLHPRTTRHEP